MSDRERLTVLVEAFRAWQKVVPGKIVKWPGTTDDKWRKLVTAVAEAEQSIREEAKP